MSKRAEAHCRKGLGLALMFVALCVFCLLTLSVKANAAGSTYTITGLDMGYNQENSDRKFTSAVWHDIELEFQGGQNYRLIGVWDPSNAGIPFTVEEATELTFDASDSFVLPAETGLDPADMNRVVVWEYEPDSYLSKDGATIQYFERVSLADGPAVTGLTADTVTISNLDAQHPVAILVKLADAGEQSLLLANEEEFDNYWHYYYTDGYAKKHGDFLLEYYDYKKTQEEIGGQTVNVLTISSFDNKGVINYPAAAYAIGIGVLEDSVFDSRYGKSPIPEGLTEKDYEIEKWSIPAQWTDPYDGLSYQVRLAENKGHSEYEMRGPYPAYPINAKDVEVSGGAIFPEDCSYLFYEGGGFQVQGHLSPAHGWVGQSTQPYYEGLPYDYHQPAHSLTRSFAITGPKMAGNVTNMSYMFRMVPKSSRLSKFDISSINTENVTDMSHMFEVTVSSDEGFVGLSSMDTSNVTNMEEMFKIIGPVNLTKEDLAGFNTEKVSNMKGMFADSDIISADLSGFSFGLVPDLSHFFYRCRALAKVVFPANMNTNLVNNMSGMFQGCQSLAEIENLSALDTGNVTDMSFMFGRYFYNAPRPYADTDYSGPSVTALDLSTFDTSNVTTMESMFKLPKATSLNLSSFNTAKVQNMVSMFNLEVIPALDLSSFNTANVVNMSGMFNLPAATALNISSFDTSNVVNMSSMFTLASLPELNLSNFNTENVTDMSGMFSLGSVESLDVSMLDTSKVTNMYSMFDLPKAKNLTLGGKFTTVSASSMSYMFVLASIKEMDVTLDISGNPSLDNLFYLQNAVKLKLSLTGNNPGCRSALTIYGPCLNTLDLSGSRILEKWFLSKNSFTECVSLLDLYLPDSLPDAWYEDDTPALPCEFYLAGRDGDEVFTDLSTITGDMSAYDVVGADDALITDPKSPRPIERHENAILLRAAGLIPTEDVALKQYKWNPDTNQYEYLDVETVTLYKYAPDAYPLEGYPNTITLMAVTDPEQVYPQPSLSWNFKENAAKEGEAVLVSSLYNKSCTLSATAGWGTCDVELTAEVPSLTGEGDPQIFKDTVSVTVVPMVRATGIKYATNYLVMHPGETLENPATISKNEDAFPGEDLTFPGATYESKNPEVVTVDPETGKLTAVAVGSAEIVATTNDPAKRKASCWVDVIDSSPAETVNWFPLMTDGKLVKESSDYDNFVALVGTKDSFEALEAKKSISYDKSSNTITLNSFNETGLSVDKENITILLKGQSVIKGNGTSHEEEGLWTGENTLIKAETGATLTTILDKSVAASIKLDSSVTKTENKDGTVTFAGPKAEAKISISKAAITGISDAVYTGAAITPAPVVKLGDVTLKAGTDYDVSYKNNKNAGTAAVTVTGKGKYTDSASTTFTIKPASISSAKLEYTSKKYTGKKLEPKVTVTAQVGGKTVTLKKNSDYTVTYKDNKNVGTATVTVKGKGNYTGSKTPKFKITQATNKISKVTPASKTLKLSTLKKKAQTVQLKATDKFGAKTTFTVKSITGKKNAKKYISVSSAGKITVKRGTPKGTYKVKVTASAKATKNYTKASLTKTIKIIVK